MHKGEHRKKLGTKLTPPLLSRHTPLAYICWTKVDTLWRKSLRSNAQLPFISTIIGSIDVAKEEIKAYLKVRIFSVAVSSTTAIHGIRLQHCTCAVAHPQASFQRFNFFSLSSKLFNQFGVRVLKSTALNNVRLKTFSGTYLQEFKSLCRKN